METLRWIVLVANTVTVGLMAGAFFVYATAVMPGLGRVDDRTFVAAFQSVDRAIINPVFLGTFVGALLLSIGSVVLSLGEETRSLLAWVVAAALLYLAVLVITLRVNVPLNDAIKAAGDPDRIDVRTVREAFDEATWVRWNIVRVVLSTAALGCLGWALALYGRVAG